MIHNFFLKLHLRQFQIVYNKSLCLAKLSIQCKHFCRCSVHQCTQNNFDDCHFCFQEQMKTPFLCISIEKVFFWAARPVSNCRDQRRQLGIFSRPSVYSESLEFFKIPKPVSRELSQIFSKSR